MEHWRKKKKIIGERANSGEFRKNKKREIERRSTTVALTFKERKVNINDNVFVIETSTKKTSKKKCECWTYMVNTLLFILQILFNIHY